MLKETIREQVAGAARSLWMNYGGVSADVLMKAYGANIARAEAVRKMGIEYIDPATFSRLLALRHHAAPLAQRLYVVEGVSAEDLRNMRPGEMLRLCETFGEFPTVTKVSHCVSDGPFFGAVPGSDITLDGVVIGAVPERTYTMADMKRAYDAGFSSSGEGWNGEHPSLGGIDSMPSKRDEYFDERAKALAAI